MNPQPQAEHTWLQKLLGEWLIESSAEMAPGQPPQTGTGSEVVRSLGGLWTIAEGQGEMPGCGTATSVMTLGFNSRTKRFVGTWVGSMMDHMWVYNGALDAAGKVLTLECEGPDMKDQTKLGKYRDVIEIVSPDHRILSSHYLGEDGVWQKFMKADYRRK